MVELMKELWEEIKRQLATQWRAVCLWLKLTNQERVALAELYDVVARAVAHAGRTGGPEVLELVLRLHALRKHSTSHDEFMEKVRVVLASTSLQTIH